ncbi:MAG TPA: nucleotide exchange factor GrpE [Acidimicrobiales bacterium]|nr:nucleotide exchange factor GrpE [Acidimicrobiales bacterium]
MQSSSESERGEQPENQLQASDANELSAELERLTDRYKRALADLDNYRKRSAREIEQRTEEVREAVIRDWLEAVDSVERAVRLDSDGTCAEGLRAVLEQMDTVLTRQGAVRIGAPGDRFDPRRHEAVAVQPSAAVPDRTILSVERSGFALGDRVIRPAQVVVARTTEHVH